MVAVMMTIGDRLSGQLCQIWKKLSGGKIGAPYRRRLLDQLLPYISSGNAGLDDELYDVAYAACYDDADLLQLAQAFETMRRDWPQDHARRNYRQLGEREKYLELRQRCMVYGNDYFDLATFHWDSGDLEQALKVAEEGLTRGKGCVDELRLLLSFHAKRSGNRERYLALQFEQAVDRLTLASYKAFQKLCKKAEWQRFEPLLLERLEDAWTSEQLNIYMYRKEHERAMAVLARMRYPVSGWESGNDLFIAKQLEPLFPEQILKFYISGLGNLKESASRSEYAHKALVLATVRRVLVDVLKDEARWLKFAGPVKQNNLTRPAFQQEFAKAVPGWASLK